MVRLDEALPADHPVRVFVDPIRSIDLARFVIPPGPQGEQPDHPHALFGILARGYLHGVRSSRKLARLARQEAAVASLAGGGQPNVRRLARCRRENAAAFTAVFQATVVPALRPGLAKLGHVAPDGAELKADTSKHKAMSSGRMRPRPAPPAAPVSIATRPSRPTAPPAPAAPGARSRATGGGWWSPDAAGRPAPCAASPASRRRAAAPPAARRSSSRSSVS